MLFPKYYLLGILLTKNFLSLKDQYLFNNLSDKIKVATYRQPLKLIKKMYLNSGTAYLIKMHSHLIKMHLTAFLLKFIFIKMQLNHYFPFIMSIK